jgi:putative addiction module killer protein
VPPTLEREVWFFVASDGICPFVEWMDSLRDGRVHSRVSVRIRRLATGNLGDVKALKDGLFEMRLHFGPGWRVYFGMEDAHIILLLTGGTKDSQERDIEKARGYWSEYETTKAKRES